MKHLSLLHQLKKKERKHWIASLAMSALLLGNMGNASAQFLPTNYDEPFREQFHFSQQSGWMNDINGIWYSDGIYHMGYQSYPFSPEGNPKFWGYATSTDMIHWEQKAPMLVPRELAGGNVPGACWSGSTIIDFNNVSGFGTATNPPWVTFYSAANGENNGGTCIAYSLDKGVTWISYENNPINVANRNAWDTRDPKVFWHEATQKWICVIYEKGFTFYNSSDLKTWTKTSNFGNGWGYECPDMFELAVDGGPTKKYVLMRADGQYYIGDFNGIKFTPDAGGPYRMVYNEGFGGGFYASQTFFPNNFPGGRIVQMAWMLGLGPGNTAPWTHNSTFPVEVKLKTFPQGIRVTRTPIAEISAAYQSTKTWSNQLLPSGKNLFAGKLSKCFDLEVVLDVSNAKASAVNFQFANRLITYNVEDKSLLGEKLEPINNQVKIRFLVDWGGVEIFGNDGVYSYVENYKLDPNNQLVSMTSNGEITVVSARLSEVERVWQGTANNTVVNNNDSRNHYNGNWIYPTNENIYYNADCAVGLNANSYVECTFKGKQISWYGLKNDDLGMATIYIDDVLVADDIDCYSQVRVVQQLFTKTDLTDGAHKIKVMLKGTKNAASRGIALVHDYFGYVSAPGIPTAGDDASDKTTYTGTWTAEDNDSTFYQYTFHKNTDGNGSFQYAFTGSQIIWYGLKDAGLGMASVYIDGTLVADDVDCYSASPEITELFAKTNLPFGAHTIKVMTKGTKNSLSTGTGLVHDYFDSPVTTPTNFDDTSSGTIYNGTWLFVNDGMYYNNSCHVSRSAEAGFEQSFTGTQISWYGLKNNDLGFATVYIDGEIAAEAIDCYSASRGVSMLFNKTGLPAGRHTIKVEVKGIKNPASNGFSLVHDYFSIANTVGPALSITGNCTFGNVKKNATITKTLVISNTDVMPISVSGIDLPAGYSVNWNNGEILAGENKEISVTFAPADIKSYSGEIKVNTTFGSISAYINGNGISETVASDLQHFIIYGQSLSTGHEAYPVSTENIAGNYMIGDQLWINYGNPNYSQLKPLKSAISLGSSDLSESPIHGAVNHIRLKQQAESPEITNRFIATSAGVSGRSIERLSKEAQIDALYNSYKTALYVGKRMADNDNASIICPAIFWLQGEDNYTTTGNGLTEGSLPTSDKDEYKSLLIKLKNNMQNEVRATYSQAEKPLFISYQVGAQYTRGAKLNIGMAQLEASNENEDIICAGPVYQMTNNSSGHLDGNGYRWYGEMLGKIYYKTKILGQDFKPLQPKSLARVAGNPKKIQVTFHVPEPPLVLDINTLSKNTNFGFKLTAPNRVTIENIQVVNDTIVEITVKEDIAAGVVAVTYGGEGTLGHGNLRDSDPYRAFFNYENPDKKDEHGSFVYPHGGKASLIPPSGEPKDENGIVIYGKPYPLYNFSVAFYYEIPEGKDKYEVPAFSNNPTSINKVKKEEASVWQSGKSLFVTISKSSPVLVEIYRVSGEKVLQFSKKVQLSGEQKEYYLNALESGIYIAKITSGNQVKSVKLIL